MPLSDSSGARASKFSTAEDPRFRPQELQGVDQRLPDLPESYGENRIVLLPRDPSWLFTYWELVQEYKEAARQAGGEMLAIRLYDVTGTGFRGPEAHLTHEHDCAEWARSWYMPVPTAGRDYLVEIGYRGANGWFPLARSNSVSVPPDRPSADVGGELATIPVDQDLPHYNQMVAQGARDSEQVLVDDGELRITAMGAPLSTAAPAADQPDSAGHVPGSAAPVPGSLQRTPGSPGYAAGSHVAGSLGHAAGSHVAGSLGFAAGSHVAGSLGHAAGAPGQPGASPYSTPSAAQGGDVADGSAPGAGVAQAGPALQEHQLLQAAVELVIVGRTTPGAMVTVAGQAVPAGPDGGFGLRISVPEGTREVPIEAHEQGTGATQRLNLRFGRDSA